MVGRGAQTWAIFLAALFSAVGVWYTTGLRGELLRSEAQAKAREGQLLQALTGMDTRLAGSLQKIQDMEKLMLRTVGTLRGAAVAGGSVNGGDCLGGGYTFSEDGFFTLGMKLWRADPVTHMLQLPSAVKRVWIDVGTHAKAGVTRPFLNTEEDLFIIGFEPNRYQWGEISTPPLDLELGPNSKDKTGKGHPRFWAIQAAASNESGYATFYRSASNMCSSLNSAVDSMKNTECGKVAEEFTVNVMLLESILQMIPPEIRIEFVKIDAQGHDLSVAQGCRSQLSRVEHIMLECQIKPIYEGAATKQEMLAWFAAQGGWSQTAVEDNGDDAEINIVFSNAAAQDLGEDVEFHRRPAPWLLQRHAG